MKIFQLARKSLLEMLREPQLLALELLLPLIFLVMTYFSYNMPLLFTYPIKVIGKGSQAEGFLTELEDLRYANGQAKFHVSQAGNTMQSEEALKSKAAVALVIVSSESQTSGDSTQQPKLRVTLRGDAVNMQYYRASTLINNLAGRYADRLAGRPEVVQVQVVSLINSQVATHQGPLSTFDLYAPGMIIFAILLLIPQTAMLVAREIRRRTLQRLRLTRLTALEFLGGLSLSQMVIAAFQVLVMFLAALALGFHSQGSPALALLVGMVICFSSIGIGLIVACFSENDSQAANIGGTASMLQVFLSGAFYQLPPITIFTLAGHQIDLFDVFPATHGLMALNQVLVYGNGWHEVAFRLETMLLLSVVYFLIGVVIFQRRQM